MPTLALGPGAMPPNEDIEGILTNSKLIPPAERKIALDMLRGAIDDLAA
jgi:hypothetical protein